MKKSISFCLFFVSIVYFTGCGDDSVSTDEEVKAAGVFVLYEGFSSDPNSFDYAYVDFGSGSVMPNLYLNNNGSSLGKTPDGMVLHLNQDLYITVQGNIPGQGMIYKINSSTNQLISSRSFGRNPYNIAIYDSKIYVSNLYGNHVSVMNPDLSPINDSIAVGANPTDMIAALQNIYVAKANFTTENSMAIINTITNSVNKVFFAAPPVSAANNVGGIYVSTFSNKKLYVLDTALSQPSDSISINIPEFAIGTIISGRTGKLYILALASAVSRAQKVYKLDLFSRQLDASFNISFSGNDDINGISYDPFEQRIYITNSKSGQANGELIVYDENGVLIKRYPDVGGISPKRIAIKY
jgi:hypothetical protein